MSDSAFVYAPPLIPFLDVVYLDEHLMVVDKPAGLLSVPGRLTEHQDSIITRVRTFFANASAVHRLDMDTQGLLLIPLTKTALSALGRQFERREIHKAYVALVQGQLAGCGSINKSLRCDWERRPLQIVDEKLGKPALTLYESISCLQKHTLLRLTPKTGRSHQLRVHLAFLGHPIEGDRFYAQEQIIKGNPPLCLAAVELSFCHPVSLKTLSFKLPHYADRYLSYAQSYAG